MNGDGLDIAQASFRESALELSRRGFDTIIFGHTHHLGKVELRLLDADSVLCVD